MDAHVLEPAPDSTSKAVPCLSFAMITFRPPAVALVEPLVLIDPPLASAPGAHKRRIIVAHNHGLVDAPLGEAERGQIASSFDRCAQSNDASYDLLRSSAAITPYPHP